MSRISLMDLGFLFTESSVSPKHIGGLLIFKKPKGGSSAASDLYETLRSQSAVVSPFNRVFSLSMGVPVWKEVANVDADQHIRFHSNRKKMLDEHALNTLVEELHAAQLDRSRPLWEFHIIDRLRGGRFAIYVKAHHAYADGITLTRKLVQSLLVPDDNPGKGAVWGLKKRGQRKDKKATEKGFLKLIGSSVSNGRASFSMIAGLYKMWIRWALESVKLTDSAISVPFATEHARPLTGQVSSGRRLGTAKIPMNRIKRIQTVTHSTLNHVILTCIDQALHEFLQLSSANEPKKITIQMPVSLRSKDDQSIGNKFGIVLVEMGAKDLSPYERLRDIGYALRNVRFQIDSVPASSIVAYTMLSQVLAQSAESLKISSKFPPLGHTMVSNVPGPTEKIFLRGAELEAMFPISVLTPGNHLNITVFSYADQLQIGMIATDQFGDVESLAKLVEKASSELLKATKG